MREIGGYIELDQYRLPMLHEGEAALNTGRNCLRLLLRVRGIKRIWLPDYLCDSVLNTCIEEKTEVSFYSIGADFRPREPFGLDAREDAWVYLVDFYGQLPRDWLRDWKKRYPRTILDETQHYFAEPLKGAGEMDTIYSCRKYFGVPDGAFLHFAENVGAEKADEEGTGKEGLLFAEKEATEKEKLLSGITEDMSRKRMGFLLGRLEGCASDFYEGYRENNRLLASEPIKRMSRLTRNLLHGIDYAFVRRRRQENFSILHKLLGAYNVLSPSVPEGAFAYPFLPDHPGTDRGAGIRRALQEKKIYVPTLWPELLEAGRAGAWARHLAKNLLPLPLDQRYGEEEMRYIASNVRSML